MAHGDKEGKSDEEQHTTDDERKSKSKMGALKAMARNNSRRLRDSLKRRRRKHHGSDSLLQIKDIRDAQALCNLATDYICYHSLQYVLSTSRLEITIN